MKRASSQSSCTIACKPSDNGASHQLLHGAIWQQRLSSVLFLLLLLAAGLGSITTQAQTNAYVANASGTVSVIDTATNSVVATIPVGIFPSGVAITPNGARVYVANIVNSISVIDTATNTVVVTIPSGQFPNGVAITPTAPEPTSSINS
jgi:YVTN family beta-propeller protein